MFKSFTICYTPIYNIIYIVQSIFFFSWKEWLDRVEIRHFQACVCAHITRQKGYNNLHIIMRWLLLMKRNWADGNASPGLCVMIKYAYSAIEFSGA